MVKVRAIVTIMGFVLFIPSMGRAAVAPASAPAPAPTPASSQPARLEPLVGGALRYEAPPEPWKVYGEHSDRIVRYVRDEGRAYLEVAVDDLAAQMNETQKQSYGFRLGKAIKEQVKTENSELLYGPKVQKNERFWLTLRDTRKLPTGEVVDRVQVFRAFGIYLARVAATTVSKEREDPLTKEVHALGEDLLDRMKVMRGVRPTYFPRSQVKIVPPVDWKETKVDQANGVIATYGDPRKAISKIIVRSRVIPRDARTPGPKQETFLAKAIDDQRLTEPFSTASTSRDETQESDPRTLKRIKATGEVQGKPAAVDTRYFIVSDVLVSVRAVSAPADAASLAEIAAKLMESVTPLRD
ncbi:MAG: hypothetical protein H0U59_02935 [Gemmatimonadaceae bacterium]|nr:hypothetical protein [Gemmatimonadaceae bacterium]